MDLSIRTEVFGQDDQSWLGSEHGPEAARTITLDVSTFTAQTHYPNGYFPSGLALGRISATGLYGPYDNNAGDGRNVLAGFLFTAVKAPASDTTDVAGAILEHGKGKTAKLPVPLDNIPQAQASVGTRIIFVDVQPIAGDS